MRRASKVVLVLAPTLAALAAGVFAARQSGADYNVYRNDFNVYYFASREIIEGRDPYERSLTDSTSYLYPPLLAELLIPGAFLPLPVAAYIWFLLSIASLTAAALMCGNLVMEKTEVTTLEAWSAPAVIGVLAVVAVGRFALDNLAMGQVNLVVMALAVAHVYLYARKKPLASAAALAVATAIKLTPFILIFYHIARRRFRFAAGCALLTGVVSLGSFAPLSSSAVERFASRTIGNRQGFDLGYSGNQSLRAVEARVRCQSGEAAREPFTFVSLAAGLVLLCVAFFASGRASSEAAASAPFLCCSVLLSPLSWKGHYVILLLPIALVAREAFLAGKGWRGRRWWGCLAAVFAAFNLTSPRVVGVEIATAIERWSLIIAFALLILASSVWMAFRQQGEDRFRNRKRR